MTVPTTPSADGAPRDRAGAGRAVRARRPTTRRARRATALVVVGALLLVAVVLSVVVGARPIPVGDVWGHLWQPDGSGDAAVVHEHRIPRTLLGLAAGAALGLAGALMQSLTRNPLAEPGLLGVNAGASAAVVLGVAVLGLGQAREYVWLALAGAAAAAVLVHLVGGRGASAGTPVRLALAGAAVTAVLSAVVWVVTFLAVDALDLYRVWVVGSLTGRDLTVLWQVLPFLAVGIVGGLLLAGPLNAMALGEDAGRALGLRPGIVRAATGVAVTLLCGGATAAVGPVAFLGLAVPHAVRALTGPDDRWVLPLSMLAGPVLLLGSDVLGRLVAAPGELQVGVVTAFLGAPALIWVVGRRRAVTL